MIYSFFRKLCLVTLLVAALILVSMLPGTADAAAVSEWTQTSQSDFGSGTHTNLDITSSPGDVKLSKNGSDYVYAFKGNGTNTFWRYDVSAGTWSQLANAPGDTGAGSRVYSVNKEAVMAPLPAFGALAVVFALGIFIVFEVIHARRVSRYVRYRRDRMKLR